MIADKAVPSLFLALIFLWALTSSVLRAPALALVAKRTPKPALPLLGTLVVIGTALAAAAGPCLALIAKEVDPRWPFLLATLTLLAAVVGLALAVRRGALAASGDRAGSEEGAPTAPANEETITAFFVAAALLAIGQQIHTNVNTSPWYKQFASADGLPWLLPVFAVGASLLAFAGGKASKRAGALTALRWAAFLGAVFCVGAAMAPGLVSLTALQFLAGGAWGAINACSSHTRSHSASQDGKGRWPGGCPRCWRWRHLCVSDWSTSSSRRSPGRRPSCSGCRPHAGPRPRSSSGARSRRRRRAAPDHGSRDLQSLICPFRKHAST